MLFVHKKLKSHMVLQTSTEDSQAVCARVEDVALTTLYQCPNGLRLPLGHFVEESRQLLPLNVTWIGGGEFNDVPAEAHLSLTFVEDGFKVKAVRDCTGAFCPTRWGGNRAIDYHLVNRQECMKDLHFHQEAISDHRVVCCNLLLPKESRDEVTRWFGNSSKACPSNASKNDFEKVFLEKWDKLKKPVFPPSASQEEVDELWLQTQACYELALNYACRSVSQEVHDEDAGKLYGLSKGHVRFQNGYPRVGKNNSLSDAFLVRRLRNVVGRLTEVRRLEHVHQESSQDYKNLAVKVLRAPGCLMGDTQ